MLPSNIKESILFTTILVFHVGAYFEKQDGLIYILIWSSTQLEPFNFIDMGQKPFLGCDYENCFLTGDHEHLEDILDYEVIIFNIFDISDVVFPPIRTEEQKYILQGVEPAGMFIMPEEFNGLFNLTFTYKTNSNITIPYVVVKDENKTTIGPKADMKWLKLSEMNETSDYVKSKLQNKTTTAAWLVSHCNSAYRTLYAEGLQKELAKRGHILDIYGKCGNLTCPMGELGTVCGKNKCPSHDRMDECLSLIESDYFFYLAFENSFGEDYVSEKILHALEHFAVPVVYGTAKYNRYECGPKYFELCFISGVTKLIDTTKDVVGFGSVIRAEV